MIRTISEEVAALGAPAKVRDAARTIDSYLDSKLTPPRDLVEYVMAYVGKARTPNRYGGLDASIGHPQSVA